MLNQTGLLLAKSAQLSWKFDLEATRKQTKLYRIDCSTNRAFCIYLIAWTALFDKRSLPWRSVAEASLVNHERFPGRNVLKSALLNGQTWVARSGTRVAELGSPAGLKNKKNKKLMPWLVTRTLLQPWKSCRTDGQNISSFGHGRCARTRLRLEMEQISLSPRQPKARCSTDDCCVSVWCFYTRAGMHVTSQTKQQRWSQPPAPAPATNLAGETQTVCTRITLTLLSVLSLIGITSAAERLARRASMWMKTATHGTDEGRSRVKGIDCSAPDSKRWKLKSIFHRSILRFLCPPTLPVPLGPRTQSRSIVSRSITLHAGTSCEEFTWLRSKISWDIWLISCDIGDCRCRWRRNLWKKLDAASRFESFFFLSLKRQRSAGKTACRYTYTGASVFNRRQKFCESATRLDGLVNPR